MVQSLNLPKHPNYPLQDLPAHSVVGVWVDEVWVAVSGVWTVLGPQGLVLRLALCLLLLSSSETIIGSQFYQRLSNEEF